MGRRILIVLRGKLGDTIVSFATVRAWADAFPEDEVTVLVRANYAPLFAAEPGIRIIGFGSRLAMYARLARMRLFEPPFDALLVLLGFGPPIERLGRMVRASRKVYADGRFSSVYPEWPQVRRDHYQHEPAWCVANLVAPGLAMPRQMRIASLAARRKPVGAFGIAPVSDETRRTMSPDALHQLIEQAAHRHPAASARVLVNREDSRAQAILERPLPNGASFRAFPTLPDLVDELGALDHLYTTDTGVFHLAAAMAVPTTAYFGPTQPWKVGLPDQPALVRVRLAALGGEHCEEKTCTSAACLNHAVRVHMGVRQAGVLQAPDIDSNPAGCLLRKYPAHELDTVTANEGPGHQA